MVTRRSAASFVFEKERSFRGLSEQQLDSLLSCQSLTDFLSHPTSRREHALKEVWLVSPLRLEGT